MLQVSGLEHQSFADSFHVSNLLLLFVKATLSNKAPGSSMHAHFARLGDDIAH